ncbi:hypothetical protein EOD39_7089 [Acipenser ruthenus]|uniref:G-protein coupled receptors family 1 profile domain-containing protein n=1 Tax=Acipenser ruthenus TaxID=7906 RepID=A0A444U840_ACIRT|nr:hypothetical protein EOD39_7089 [Acipenser ruthenus]
MGGYGAVVQEMQNSTNVITSCSVSEDYKQILLPLTYSVVFVVGLLLNGVVLWMMCCRTKKWSCSMIYLTNLALADLLNVLSLPLLIVYYCMDDRWMFGAVACKLVRFFFYASLYASILFLTCISVHRFIGVCYPIRCVDYTTKKIAIVGSVIAWILVVVQVFPTLMFSNTGLINNQTVCYDLTEPHNLNQYFPYGIALNITGFLIPFAIISICYCSIIRTLSKSEESITVGNQIRRKSIRTIVVVCIIFAICYVPFHITRTIYMFVAVYMPLKDCSVLKFVMMSYKIWRPIVNFNSCINPVLFFLLTDRNRTRILAELVK